MKIIGSIMVIISTTLLGLNEFSLIKRRVTFLEQMQVFIDRIMTEIRYISSPVAEIIESLGKREELPDVLKEIVDFEKSLSECVAQADGKVFRKNAMTTGDIEGLTSFVNELGRSDIEGQIANCKLYKSNIEYELELLRRDIEKKGKIYLTVGLAAGIVTVLLLS